MRACSPTPRATTTLLDNRLVRYDIEASIAHAEMLGEQGLLSAADLAAIRGALAAIGEEHARGEWRITLEQEDCQTAIENLLTARIGARRRPPACRPLAQRSGAGRAAAVPARRRGRPCTTARSRWRDALDALAARDGSIALPGYTHMQQAMPSTVALWALGFAAEIRDDAEGLQQAQRRIDKNPLGSAAGYGTPNLDDRAAKRRAAGSASPSRTSRSPRCSCRAARPRRSCCSRSRC